MNLTFRELNPQERELLESWKGRVRKNQVKHYDEEERLKRLHYWLGIPAITLSVAVATMMLILLKLVGEDWLKIMFGILGFIAAFLTSLQTVLKLSERADVHKKAAIKYGSIFREIERVLASSLLPTAKIEPMLKRIETKLNEAAGSAPTVPRRQWKSVKEHVTPPNEDQGRKTLDSNDPLQLT